MPDGSSITTSFPSTVRVIPGWSLLTVGRIRSLSMPERPSPLPPGGARSAFSRRRFLAGAARLTGGAVGFTTLGTTLAACGDDTPSGGVGGPDGGPAPIILVHLFSTNRVIAAGLAQRIPFAVVNQGDVDLRDDVELPVRVLDGDSVVDETTVVGRVVNHDHVDPDIDPDHQHADLLRYFALRTTLPEAGVYDIEVDFGPSGLATLPVQCFDPAEISVVLPGQEAPALVTPTVDEAAGVSPICTRAPEPCPFHGLTLADALAAGRPVALLVATPALCQTAYCGPVLETLIEEAPTAPEVTPIHLEFYANADEVAGNYDDDSLRLADQVTALGLDFEPSLVLIGSDGVIVDRIDNLFDAAELRSALATLG